MLQGVGGVYLLIRKKETSKAKDKNAHRPDPTVVKGASKRSSLLGQTAQKMIWKEETIAKAR